MSVSPQTYRRVAGAAVVALAIIVLTGAAVRLTGSGLGCTDWPTCDGSDIVAPLEFHAQVEFLNRLFTGVVSVSVVAAVLGAVFRRPRRRDLLLLAFGLVAGVAANAILGGLTVLYELPPILVIGHFLLSMLLLWNALVLFHRAGSVEGRRRWRTEAVTARLSQLVFVGAAIVLVTGTIVTGTGPNGGDEEVARLPFFLPTVARVHGASVLILVLATALLAWRLARTGGPRSVRRATHGLLAVMIAQGAVGYIQYFNGVPALLVAFHVLGAVLVWLGAVELVSRNREPLGDVLAPEDPAGSGGESPLRQGLDTDDASPSAVHVAQWTDGGPSPTHETVGDRVS